VREAERQVEVGEIAVKKAERTLQSWLLTDEEIEAVKAESERIHNTSGKEPKEDPNWARVEVLAPSDGTIVEKNIVVGDLVDSGAELFKIADLSVLSAWAHVYEEDLALLDSLPKPRSWKLRVNSHPTATEIVGSIDRIGEIVDPSEHMGLVAGVVQNPTGELRAGQFITAFVELPQEPDVVEIPTRALVEDGDESVVLVQTDPAKAKYTKRRVSVVRRYYDVVYVRSQLTSDQVAQGLQELRIGERVVSAGALELKAALSEQRQPPESTQSHP
jgi:cobalt-zinc-cadmium efflux system membrane fusion protein